MKLIKGGIVSAAFVLAAISIQMFGNRTVQAQVTTPTVVDPTRSLLPRTRSFGRRTRNCGR